MKGIRLKKGFTLVELIVVIAIIAILATVSIVGFMRFIENARISNDNELAAQMTNLVQYHITSTGEDDLDANDVRTIVLDNSGDRINFEPQTEGAAFVYVAETQTVVFAKVDDIIGGAVELKSSNTTHLLSQKLDLEEGIGDTPEEIFGPDTFLLSKGGSTIASAVAGLRALATSSSLEDDYQEIQALAGDDSLIDGLLDKFTLQNTLFVNNNDWPNLPNTPSAPFSRILFQDNIKNVPAMVMNSRNLLTIESTITLPRSVFSIESEAFSKVLLPPGVTFRFGKTGNLSVENGAFTAAQVEDLELNITLSEFPGLGVLAEYSNDGLTWTPFEAGTTDLTSDTRVRFDIQGTPRSLIDDLAIQRIEKSDGYYYVIRAYNDESGLIGVTKFAVSYTN